MERRSGAGAIMVGYALILAPVALPVALPEDEPDPGKDIGYKYGALLITNGGGGGISRDPELLFTYDSKNVKVNVIVNCKVRGLQRR